MDKAGYGPLNMKLFFTFGCSRDAIKIINNTKNQMWFKFITAYGWAEYKLDWDGNSCKHPELKFELPDESICWHFAD